MDATGAGDRFAFGENWRSFASAVDDDRLAEARRGLLKLFPNGELTGARVLDIGCGSGLSMLAALQLGAGRVHGIDIDPDSVTASLDLLSKFNAMVRREGRCLELCNVALRHRLQLGCPAPYRNAVERDGPRRQLRSSWRAARD